MTETCKWIESGDDRECGEPAPYQVRVRGKITHALVPLCGRHKADHDQSFAKLRAAGRAAS